MKDLQKIKLEPFISGDLWSYIKNQNGNMVRTTLVGYGSSTPSDILQDYINSLSKKEKQEISNDCDKKRDS